MALETVAFSLGALSLGAAFFLSLATSSTGQIFPVTFVVDPSKSNWTWSQDDRSPDNYGYATVEPPGFPLGGFITANVTSCSPDRLNNNVSRIVMTGTRLVPYRALPPGQMTVGSNGVGNLSAIDPAFNLTSGSDFSVEQQYGGFEAIWLNPQATWRNVTGYLDSGDGFRGGPVSNSNLTVPVANFGSLRGYLTTTSPSSSNPLMSELRMFVNSTFEVDPRQLILAVNASGSLLNRIFGRQGPRAQVQLLLSGVARNPCNMVPS